MALLVSGFEDGGVERNFSHLAMGLGGLGVTVDLLVGARGHPYLTGLGPHVRIRTLEGDRRPTLAAYLAASPPDILLTGKLSDDLDALSVLEDLRARSEIGTRLVAAVGTLLSGRFAERPWDLPRRWRETRRIRASYDRLDGLTAISEGVAEDLRRVFRVTRTPIAVLNNPIVPPDHRERATAPCPHPWLSEVAAETPPGRRPPVLIALGGLRRVKDLDTLIRAFARLEVAGARLLILGEGKERADLERLVARLSLAGRVDLPGFVPDPYPYLARARLLVLSSRREGLGNVVVEALAAGTPVVATDCSQGLEVLAAQGVLPPLVPVGRPTDLARAAEPFGLMAAARAHLDFFQTLAPSA